VGGSSKKKRKKRKKKKVSTWFLEKGWGKSKLIWVDECSFFGKELFDKKKVFFF